jgi:hypothetical protein
MQYRDESRVDSASARLHALIMIWEHKEHDTAVARALLTTLQQSQQIYLEERDRLREAILDLSIQSMEMYRWTRSRHSHYFWAEPYLERQQR